MIKLVAGQCAAHRGHAATRERGAIERATGWCAAKVRGVRRRVAIEKARFPDLLRVGALSVLGGELDLVAFLARC
jgi:hypothetical protein